jgi:hypothetical protein
VRDLSSPPTIITRPGHVTVSSPPPEVEQRVTATVTPAAARQTHLLRPDPEWTWQDLRDYVVGQIQERCGEFPRDPNRETGIFKGFYSRHGACSAVIARHAFETLGGWWNGSPVGVGRFAKASDAYFAVPIIERLSSR